MQGRMVTQIGVTRQSQGGDGRGYGVKLLFTTDPSHWYCRKIVRASGRGGEVRAD